MEGGSPGLKAFFGFGIDGVYPFGCGFEFLKVILERVFRMFDGTARRLLGVWVLSLPTSGFSSNSLYGCTYKYKE